MLSNYQTTGLSCAQDNNSVTGVQNKDHKPHPQNTVSKSSNVVEVDEDESCDSTEEMEHF